MAKGMGHVLAEVHGILNPLPDDVPNCPACGKPMQAGGLGISRWFCYDGPPYKGKCTALPELAAAFHDNADEQVRLWGHFENPFQNQTLAGLIVDKKSIAYCGTIRGGQGRTNLFVEPLPGFTAQDVIEATKNGGIWIWADWTGREVTMEPLIVTRHSGLVEWLAKRGITGQVVEHATVRDVTGRIVYGNLPLHLAAYARLVVTVDMPQLAPEQRGKDLTPDEMDAAGATMTNYKVERLP